MRICGVGVDIIEIHRIDASLHRYTGRFERKVFSEDEREICERSRSRSEAYAGRFAAKEACMKSLGVGAKAVSWKDIEILDRPSGEPYVRLTGRAAQRAAQIGIDTIFVSISHSKSNAVANALSAQISSKI